MKYKFKPTPAQKYKKYMLNSIVLALAAVVIALASRSFLNKENAEEVQGELMQNTNNSYYSANDNSSQETPKIETTPLPRVTVKPKPTAKPSYTPTPTPSPSSPDIFTITLYEGKISVFKNEEKTPEMTLQTPVEWLTEEDIFLLNEGIELYSMNEVRAFLEDYE